MPKTLWINPSYEPLGEEMHEDYEACFSVKDIAGLVRRYKQVHYRAYDKDGKLIEGKAEGFLARIIQHEIDHLNGILFVDLVPQSELMSIEEYRKKRAAMMEQKIN
jgi:peptide deformylase